MITYLTSTEYLSMTDEGFLSKTVLCLRDFEHLSLFNTVKLEKNRVYSVNTWQAGVQLEPLRVALLFMNNLFNKSLLGDLISLEGPMENIFVKIKESNGRNGRGRPRRVNV